MGERRLDVTPCFSKAQDAITDPHTSQLHQIFIDFCVDLYPLPSLLDPWLHFPLLRNQVLLLYQEYDLTSTLLPLFPQSSHFSGYNGMMK